MHNLKTQYFKESGKWYMDEGYCGDTSNLQVTDVPFDDLEDMAGLDRRLNIHDKAEKVLKQSGLKYLVIVDDEYLGYPMLVINDMEEK